MSNRLLKINELICQQLGQIIIQEIEFPPGTLVTPTRVDVSSDLKQAKIYISVLPVNNQQLVMKILIRQANNLQRLLNNRITLKNIPKLRFFIDETEERVKKLDELLDNLKSH